MRAVVHHLGLDPAEWDGDPTTYVPDDPERFVVRVELTAGSADSPGGDLFFFEVCNPAWLLDRVQQEGPMSGRHLVVVEHFNWEAVKTYFHRLLTRIWGENWNEVAEKIARYGLWEYEDYTTNHERNACCGNEGPSA